MTTSISHSEESPIITTHCFLLMQMHNSALAHHSTYPERSLSSMCDVKALNQFCSCSFGWRRSHPPAASLPPEKHSLWLFLLLCSWGFGLLSLQGFCRDPVNLFFIFTEAKLYSHLLLQLPYQVAQLLGQNTYAGMGTIFTCFRLNGRPLNYLQPNLCLRWSLWCAGVVAFVGVWVLWVLCWYLGIVHHHMLRSPMLSSVVAGFLPDALLHKLLCKLLHLWAASVCCACDWWSPSL